MTGLLGLKVLSGEQAMALLAKAVDWNITAKDFVSLLHEYQLAPSICSERLCWFLLAQRLGRETNEVRLKSIFGETVASTEATVARDEEMVVLTRDNVELEFPRNSYQQVLHCGLEYRAGQFDFLDLGGTEFVGVSVAGQTVRWRAQRLLNRNIKPVFMAEDIQLLVERIIERGSKGEEGEEYKYQLAEVMIIDAIRSLGENPKALAKEDSGKSGIKSKVRRMVSNRHPFNAKYSFDNHWRQLLREGTIVRAEKKK